MNFNFEIRKTLQTWKRKCEEAGTDLGGGCLYTLQFVNVWVIIANHKKDLRYMAQKLREECKTWGLEINTQKHSTCLLEMIYLM